MSAWVAGSHFIIPEMRKLIIYILSLSLLPLLPSCNNEDKIEGFKANEILVVTLEIVSDIEIKQIALNSDAGTVIISGNQVAKKDRVKLKTPQMGEGTYSICVYTATDTLCSKETYVEGGYRPILRFENKKFQTIEWW